MDEKELNRRNYYIAIIGLLVILCGVAIATWVDVQLVKQRTGVLEQFDSHVMSTLYMPRTVAPIDSTLVGSP